MRKECTNLLFFTFSLCLNYNANSQITSAELIRKSSEYYQSLEQFSVQATERRTTMITVDTSEFTVDCYINKNKDQYFFTSPLTGFLRINQDEYFISYKDNFFVQIKNKNKKHTTYESYYKHYPFTETGLFFKNLSKALSGKIKVNETDSTYWTMIGDKLLHFRKIDYSIKSITELRYDPIHKGYAFHQTLFSLIGSANMESITTALSIINDPSAKRDPDKKREPGPEFIERKFLEKNVMKRINGNLESIKNKIVFLDFFFQGCYPCVKSYPHINSLFEAKDTNLIVIGVDPFLGDSATIEKYIEKHSLKYPILVGEPAKFLAEFFKIRVFPTFIIIGHDGKIIEYGYGFSKSSFNRLTKSLVKKEE